ncbi:hypothetical protein FX016_22590 [Cupriavidus gilardii]|nr:hypothetical protein FX016_22590 [Cupriavidus gilardii]
MDWDPMSRIIVHHFVRRQELLCMLTDDRNAALYFMLRVTIPPLRCLRRVAARPLVSYGARRLPNVRWYFRSASADTPAI